MVEQLLFSDVVTEFLEERKSRGRTTGTVLLYGKELSYFANWLAKENTNYVHEITSKLLRNWFSDLATHRNKNGVHFNYRVIRTLLRWVTIEYELLWKNPIDKVFIQQGKNLPLEEIPIEMVQKLINTSRFSNHPLRDKAILKMLVDTGLRGSELLSLNRKDIDLKSGRVLVHYAKMGIPCISFLGRSSLKALNDYLRTRTDNLEPLFINDENKRLKFMGLKALITRLCKSANVKQYPIHSFRRCFVLTTYRKTRDIFLVSKLLHHSKVETTVRYLNIVNEDLQRSFLSASPADLLQ